MLDRIATWALRAPRRVAALVAFAAVTSAILGVPVASHLTAGGFQDPAAESARANRTLTEVFGKSEVQLVLVVGRADGRPAEAVEAAGRQMVGLLERSPNVIGVLSPWTSPPQIARALDGADGSGLVIADLRGGESRAPGYGADLVAAIGAEILPQFPGVQVQAGGSAMVFAQITDQTLRDVLIMESIAVPLSLLVLVWVFGGLLAATLPLIVAAAAIAGTLAVLRGITLWTDVSIFALSLATALGFALAVDYTLLILSRYRDERADGADRDRAVRATMRTAGRTIVFSAFIVTLSMATLVLFPIPFLRSFAYAGVATVSLCALAALVLTPTGIVVFGERLTIRPGRHQPGVRQGFWYRSTAFVIRHALVLGVGGFLLLALVGAPFLDARWGNPDDRALPRSASAHQVGDVLRAQFPGRSGTESIVVVPDAQGLSPADWDGYSAAASRIESVLAVSGPTGTFVAGRMTGPPAGGTEMRSGSAYLTVTGAAALFTEASETQLHSLRALPGPGGRAVEITGAAAVNSDGVQAIAARLPVVLGLMAAVIFVVLFALTASVVLPLKALVLNTLSLSAAFGALVWIFQDGHLGAFGTTPTGTLVATIPVLLFCIAFGLSMDYEVFLLARIREFWLEQPDQDRSITLGLAHTGRVVTAAALIMSISFAGLIAAQVSFMRMFGVGLVLAVLVDATLVRMVMLPAFMHLLGRWNWWAPQFLRRPRKPVRS
ncbi:MMPL family transporter [Mycobacterium sp. AMU20-3851]|uniref:MMPL family transporter n=1 Tax=Mycobacterium sp. AMU20-3851 TaxID=3122055 RepID=UPI0037546B47